MHARAYFPILRNGVKMEMVSPRNDRTTELNVKFLLTTTVIVVSLPPVHDLQSYTNFYFLLCSITYCINVSCIEVIL